LSGDRYALGLLVYAQAFEIPGVAESLDDMAVQIPDPRAEEMPT
jgi:hypothetical protein